MKKIVLITIISLMFIFAVGVYASTQYNVKFTNKNVSFTKPTYMKDDRIYVSLRDICNALNIPIYWDGDINEATIDVNNKKINVSDKTEYKDCGVIPDEETAYAVGKIILEKYSNSPMEYETKDKIYYLEVEFIEEQNCWSVVQKFKFKAENKGWAAGGNTYYPNVKLNKSTGEILYINTYATFID